MRRVLDGLTGDLGSKYGPCLVQDLLLVGLVQPPSIGLFMVLCFHHMYHEFAIVCSCKVTLVAFMFCERALVCG